jgi:hypothetical protein
MKRFVDDPIKQQKNSEKKKTNFFYDFDAQKICEVKIGKRYTKFLRLNVVCQKREMDLQ